MGPSISNIPPWCLSIPATGQPVIPRTNKLIPPPTRKSKVHGQMQIPDRQIVPKLAVNQLITHTVFSMRNDHNRPCRLSPTHNIKQVFVSKGKNTFINQNSASPLLLLFPVWKQLSEIWAECLMVSGLSSTMQSPATGSKGSKGDSKVLSSPKFKQISLHCHK